MVAAAGATMLRGGAFKPRTSPYTFQGLGLEALDILREAREETGLPIVTELMDPRHVEEVVEAADVIQIGARNMQNFLLLAEVGRAAKPVLLKRGPSASVEELLMAAEYVAKEGNDRIILCERGIKTFETSTRYTLDLGSVAVLKEETHLPVIVDPSHAAGRRQLVLPLARAAAAVGRRRDHRRGAPAARGSALRRPSAAARGDVRRVRGRDPHDGGADGPPDRLAIGDRAARGPRHGADRDLRGAGGQACRRRQRRRVRPRRRARSRSPPSAAPSTSRPARSRRRSRGATLAVVAAPVSQLAALLPAVLAGSSAETTVTDVGSTKAAIAAAASRNGALRRRPSDVRLGVARARARDRRPVRGRDLVPDARSPETEPASHRLVHGFVTGLGATPVAIEPEAHDRIVALTSHLPHALANLLVNQAGETRVEGHDPLAAAGGSLREMTRVAGRQPADLGRHLPRERRGARRRRSPTTAAGSASSSRRSRRATPASSPAGSARRRPTGAGCSRRRSRTRAPSSELHVHVPDRPGVLAGITQALGAARINIEDFELQHVSPERGGNLTLLVAGAEAAARAAELLEEQGYGVVVEPVARDADDARRAGGRPRRPHPRARATSRSRTGRR